LRAKLPDERLENPPGLAFQPPLIRPLLMPRPPI
jgi:hypothetical protein